MKIIEPFSSTAFFYALSAAVILFSFFSFSYGYYPFFNSDAALSVLMAYDYHFPRDIYCWGQDRGGTLEMMIAHFFISFFHSPPLLASSIIHYLLLIAGLLASFHFVQNPLFRLALTVTWFFPSRFFIETILYQFGVQFSLFMIAVYFLDKAIVAERMKSTLLSLSFLFMILNVWVLDLGIIPVFFLAAFVSYRIYQGRIRTHPIPPVLNELANKKNLVISTLWMAAGTCFIVYAKNNSSGFNSYSGISLNSLNGIYNVVSSIFITIKAHYLFRAKPAESLYLYAATIFFAALAIHRSIKKTPEHLSFGRFFLWQSLLGLGVLLLLKQVQVSQVPARYFAGSYLSFTVFIFMKLDAIAFRHWVLNISLFVVLVCSVYSSLYENYFPEKLQPMVKNFQSLNSFKHVGLIGSYWNSYVFSAIDPENIKATPHDKDNVRNMNLAYETMEQPVLLLIRNEWLQNFPDTISQFGTSLIKNGNPFMMGRYISWEEENHVMACEYTRIP